MTIDETIKRLVDDALFMKSIPPYYLERMGYYIGLAYSIGYNDSSKKRATTKPVGMYNQRGSLLDRFDSVAQASDSTGIERTNISQVARKERKTAGGYIWKYLT